MTEKKYLKSFIDNQNQNTLAKAINKSLGLLKKDKKMPDELQIATAFFNPQGLNLIANEAKHLNSIKLLLGAEPETEIIRKKRHEKAL